MRVTVEFPTVTSQEFPQGLCCVRCEREIPVGTPYAEMITQPGNMEAEDAPAPESAASSIENFRDAVAGAGVGETVCVYCVGENT